VWEASNEFTNKRVDPFFLVSNSPFTRAVQLTSTSPAAGDIIRIAFSPDAAEHWMRFSKKAQKAKLEAINIEKSLRGLARAIPNYYKAPVYCSYSFLGTCLTLLTHLREGCPLRGKL
jgi:hypothetical protein